MENQKGMEKINICLLTKVNNVSMHYRDLIQRNEFSTVNLIVVQCIHRHDAYQKLGGIIIKGVILDFPIQQYKERTSKQIKEKVPLSWTEEFYIYQFCLSRIR